MFTSNKLVYRLASILLLSIMFSGFQSLGVSAQRADGIRRQVNAETGKVSFISPKVFLVFL